MLSSFSEKNLKIIWNPQMRFFGQNVKTPIFQKVVFGGIDDGYKSLFKIGFINIVSTQENMTYDH